MFIHFGCFVSNNYYCHPPPPKTKSVQYTFPNRTSNPEKFGDSWLQSLSVYFCCSLDSSGTSAAVSVAVVSLHETWFENGKLRKPVTESRWYSFPGHFLLLSSLIVSAFSPPFPLIILELQGSFFFSTAPFSHSWSLFYQGQPGHPSTQPSSYESSRLIGPSDSAPSNWLPWLSVSRVLHWLQTLPNPRPRRWRWSLYFGFPGD